MTYIPYSIGQTRDTPGCRAASRSDKLPDGRDRFETDTTELTFSEWKTKGISA